MKVRFRSVSMHFGDIAVLDDINLDVAEGELVCILGPSGCGKSTLLNIAGGFLEPAAGEVTIDGQRVAGPDRRRIFVFQERGVFPWLTVEGNIGFGLFDLPASERRARIAHYVQLVGLQGFERAYPRELSGGMLRTPFAAAMTIGKSEAMKMRKIGAALPMPNQITASGIHASGEIGRSIWMSGLTARASDAYQPRRKPRGMPITIAAI